MPTGASAFELGSDPPLSPATHAPAHDRSKPQSFELAKEIIAGFAGAEVDKLIETKGE
jgi:hypothetical protein